MAPERRSALLAGAWFALLACAVLVPSGFLRNDVVLGDPRSDIHPHLWALDWAKTGLLAHGRPPLSTDTINYPTGGRLIAADLLNCVIAAPLQAAFGLARAYWLVAAMNWWFAGFAFFLLARALTKSAWAAAVAGTVYALLPYTIGYGLCSGVPEINTAGFFPLLVYFVLRAIRGGRGRDVAFAGVTALALALNAVHSLVMVSIALVALGVYALAAARGRGDLLLSDAADSESGRGGTRRRTVLALAVSLAAMLPYALLAWRTVHAADSLIPRDALAERQDPQAELRLDNYQPSAEFPYYAPLTDYVAPGKSRPIVMDEITRFYHSSYLGLTVLALAALGLAGRRRFAWFLAALAGLAAILGAGPNLVVARGVGLQTAGNPLFLAFYYVWPGFRVMMEPLRFAWLAGFGACLLAAAGVARLAVGRCRHAIGGAVVALVAADLIWLSPVPFPYPATHLAAPRVYETIAAGPARQAVLELPVWIGETAMMPRERFYHQTLHRHPIADNISGHVAPYLLGNNLTRQLLKIGSPKRYAAFPDLSLEACRDGLDRLRADGFGWILLQQDQYEPAALTRTRALLDALLPAPLVAADGYVLYSLLNETKP